MLLLKVLFQVPLPVILQFFFKKYNVYNAYWYRDCQRRMRCTTYNSESALRLGNFIRELCSINDFWKLICYRVLKYIFQLNNNNNNIFIVQISNIAQ